MGEPGTITHRPRVLAVLAAVVMIPLLTGFAVVLRDSQSEAKQALADRYAARAGLTASFTRSFVDDIAAREEAQATRALGGDTIDQAAFDQLVKAFGFDAAVVLDSDGHLLAVYPAKPELLGTDLGSKYAHLRTALSGGVGVSEVVPSAAQSISVTAVAVPYESPSGRRVFSGALSPATTPLGSYFQSSITPIAGSDALLIDTKGTVLAAAHGDPVLNHHLGSLHSGVQEIATENGALTVAVADVPGTPWRTVLSSPSAGFYAPLAKGHWAPWLLWGAFALCGLGNLVLLFHLGRARMVAATNARTDVLTGLPNRRAMDEMLGLQVAAAARHRFPLTALLLDLDHFKLINDTRGHRGGDDVLRATAQRLRAVTRTGDITARWGGEEFLMLLPFTDVAGACTLAERIRAAVRAEGVTVSIGIALLEGDDADALIAAADAALYRAKGAGRDCVIVAEPADVRVTAGA